MTNSNSSSLVLVLADIFEVCCEVRVFSIAPPAIPPTEASSGGGGGRLRIPIRGGHSASLRKIGVTRKGAIVIFCDYSLPSEDLLKFSVSHKNKPPSGIPPSRTEQRNYPVSTCRSVRSESLAGSCNSETRNNESSHEGEMRHNLMMTGSESGNRPSPSKQEVFSSWNPEKAPSHLRRDSDGGSRRASKNSLATKQIPKTWL
jgi:hypothetical protein